MADQSTGRVASIVRYAEKGKAGIPLQSAMFLQNMGMEGDLHADGGERQISLLSSEARQWMQAQTEPGLCFARFKENLSHNGIPIERLSVGTRLKAGNAILEISAQSKHCHPECPLFSQGRACRLSTQSLFAKVVQSGSIQVGDKIEQEDEDETGAHAF